MKRRAFLRRRTRLRGRSRTKVYRRRPRDLAYLRQVRSLPCVVPELLEDWGCTPCSGPVQADHVGRRAFGQKCPDDQTASICRGHHGERTDYRGTFAGYGAAEMRCFCDRAIAVTKARLAARGAGVAACDADHSRGSPPPGVASPSR
jgi:hypothetical protein